MIFALATDECTLFAFESETVAVANCEGLDVEAADWLFWDDQGNPLEAVFSVPNNRGFFVVENGIYSLALADENHHARLCEAVEEVRNFALSPPLNSAASVLAYITRNDGGKVG